MDTSKKSQERVSVVGAIIVETALIPNKKRFKKGDPPVYFSDIINAKYKDGFSKITLVFVNCKSTNEIKEVVQKRFFLVLEEMEDKVNFTIFSNLLKELRMLARLKIELCNSCLGGLAKKELVEYIGKKNGLEHIKAPSDIVLISREV